MMLAKGEDKSVQSACFYTAPWQIGKKIAEALDEVAKVKGFEGNMKKRHPGLEWIGIDKGALTEDCDYLEKMGWVATPDSCHGAANLDSMVPERSELFGFLNYYSRACRRSSSLRTCRATTTSERSSCRSARRPSTRSSSTVSCAFFSHATIAFI